MIQFSTRSTDIPSAVRIIPVWEGDDLKKILPNAVFPNELAEDMTGKPMQSALIYDQDGRILLLGLGKKDELTVRRWKQVLGMAVIACQHKKITEVSLQIPKEVIKQFGLKQLAIDTTVAVEVANYCFDDHRDKESRAVPIKAVVFDLSLTGAEKRAWQSGVDEGVILAAAVNHTRHLGNTPPSHMNPTVLAKEAEKLAKTNEKLTVKVLGRKDAEKLGMGCFLAVARGSSEEPKFIIMEYVGGKKSEAPTVLVGKGITFDSGGLSIKPGDFMVDMKFDMLGGATVLGIMEAVAKLNVKKNIIGLIPACENMPSGTAYRPDDILTAMNGKTVLIENTDAEGRLILADALCYAAKYTPKEVIDFATLTGACMVALGNERSGLFTPHDDLAEDLVKEADKVGEQLWRLPVGEEYTEAIKADVADVKNMGGVGSPRFAGASTAAAFLQYFTSYRWAHIDLSCSYYGPKGKSYIRGGANGFGVQTMVEYLRK